MAIQAEDVKSEEKEGGGSVRMEEATRNQKSAEAYVMEIGNKLAPHRSAYHQSKVVVDMVLSGL